jgi:hypothetical protein
MRYPSLALLLLISFLALPPARAQENANFILVNRSQVALDEAALRAAAGPLIEEGAIVAVYFIQAGGEPHLRLQLEAAGLLEEGQLAPQAIVLYVSQVPRYSAVQFGADWDERLYKSPGHYRQTVMNDYLEAGLYQDSLSRTLAAIHADDTAPYWEKLDTPGRAKFLLSLLIFIGLAWSQNWAGALLQGGRPDVAGTSGGN